MPKALQRDKPGRLLLPRRHLIPSRPNRVTFPLNFKVDTFSWTVLEHMFRVEGKRAADGLGGERI